MVRVREGEGRGVGGEDVGVDGANLALQDSEEKGHHTRNSRLEAQEETTIAFNFNYVLNLSKLFKFDLAGALAAECLLVVTGPPPYRPS